MSLGVQSGGGAPFNLEMGTYTGSGSTDVGVITFQGTPVFIYIEGTRGGSYGTDKLVLNASFITNTYRLNGIAVYGQSFNSTNAAQTKLVDKTLWVTTINTSGSRAQYSFNYSDVTYTWFALTI